MSADCSDLTNKESGESNNMQSIIPPLLSSTPPPDLNESEKFNSDSLNRFDKNFNLTDSNDSSSHNSSISLPNNNNNKQESQLKTSNSAQSAELSQSDELNYEKELNFNSQKVDSFDAEWNPFSSERKTSIFLVENDQINVNSNEINFSNSFDNAGSWAVFDTQSAMFDQNNTSEINEKLNIENAAEHENEDEWGTFVEVNTCDQKSHMSDSVILREDDQIKTQQPHNEFIHFHLDNFLEKLFDNSHLANFSLNGKCDENELENLIIDCDLIWQQMQRFTSITDASDSLKFKWNSSDLEDNYLHSLNLEKNINQKENIRNNLAFSSILQPVKIDSHQPFQNQSQSQPQPQQQAQLILTPVTQVTNSSNKQDEVNISNKLNDTITLSTVESNSILFNSPAFELDLSYFEAKENSNTTPKTISKTDIDLSNGSSFKLTNNKLTGISNTVIKSEQNSKVYLDKLLEEIFTNNSNSKSTKDVQTGFKKEEDLFSDKKSLSSLSSSSSSNELSTIQLQPLKLESQHYADQLQQNHANDEKALEIMSKLPNLTINSAKIIAFPLKQIQRQLNNEN